MSLYIRPSQSQQSPQSYNRKESPHPHSCDIHKNPISFTDHDLSISRQSLLISNTPEILYKSQKVGKIHNLFTGDLATNNWGHIPTNFVLLRYPTPLPPR